MNPREARLLATLLDSLESLGVKVESAEHLEELLGDGGEIERQAGEFEAAE